MKSECRQHTILMFTIHVVLLVLFWTCQAASKCVRKNTTYITVTNVLSTDAPRRVSKHIEPEKLHQYFCTSIEFVAFPTAGHVCIQQFENYTQILTSNLDLNIYDGSQLVITIGLSKRWLKREYCSASNSMKFEFFKHNNLIEVNLDNLHINLVVVHIESSYRKLYTEGDFCDSVFKMSSSKVRIYNKSPNSVSKPSEKCQIILEKVNKDSPLCLYYKIQSQESNHKFDWKIYVTSQTYSLDPEHVVYSFDATNVSSGKWCDEIDRDKIIIVYDTKQSEPFPSEPAVFEMIATDLGGQKQLTQVARNTTEEYLRIEPIKTRSLSTERTKASESAFQSSLPTERSKSNESLFHSNIVMPQFLILTAFIWCT